MTTPAERVELMLDIQDQVEDHNRAERNEYSDARVAWHPSVELDYPDAAEIARGNAEARADYAAYVRECNEARAREAARR